MARGGQRPGGPGGLVRPGGIRGHAAPAAPRGGAHLHPPKIFVGFSDITALHVLLNRNGLVTVHGPVVTQLGRLGPEAIDHLEGLLFGGRRRSPTGACRCRRPGRGVLARTTLRPGMASGQLLGGSLTVLSHLCGTRWQPRFAGAVLFLEDVGERPYRIDRMLTQLRLSGALDRVAGIAIGQFTQCDDPELEGVEVVRRVAWDLGVPDRRGGAGRARGRQLRHAARVDGDGGGAGPARGRTSPAHLRAGRDDMTFPFAVPPGVAPAWDAVVLRGGVVVHASSGGTAPGGTQTPGGSPAPAHHCSSTCRRSPR